MSDEINITQSGGTTQVGNVQGSVHIVHCHYYDVQRNAPMEILTALTVPVPEMVHIPAGPFLMGSDPKCDPNAQDDEMPQITVDLPDYWIGKYPVTVGVSWYERGPTANG